MRTLRIACIGDIMAKPGRMAVRSVLPKIILKHEIDFVVANGENTSGGMGLTPKDAKDLLSCGVHVITTGNHVWRQRELRACIEDMPVLRPHNFGDKQPGSGWGLFETAAGIPVAVVNVAGQVFMDTVAENPFVTIERLLAGPLAQAAVIVVDFHAEATSEKRAMGHFLDGRVSAVVGTHTHVQTADAHVMSQGTAYMTDLGMTGPHDSVIGMRAETIVERFATGMPGAFKPAKDGVRFQGAVVEVDANTGKALSIEAVDVPVSPSAGGPR